MIIDFILEHVTIRKLMQIWAQNTLMKQLNWREKCGKIFIKNGGNFRNHLYSRI